MSGFRSPGAVMRCIVAAVVLAALAMPAQAQTPLCAPREYLIAELVLRFSERLEHVGLQGDNTMVEIWISETGSFTVLITGPDGLSCVIASGGNWWSFRGLPDTRHTPTLKEFAI